MKRRHRSLSEENLPRKVYLARRRRRRRRQIHAFKPDFHVRKKKRPTGCENYEFEIRIKMIATWVELSGGKLSSDYKKLCDLITLIKETVRGKYKIVQHTYRHGFAIQTTILLDRDVGIMMLRMAYPTMVAKVYRYYDPEPDSSSSNTLSSH